MSLHSLGITEAAGMLADGRVSSEELVADCLRRIDEFEPDILAWAHLNEDFALAQAKNRDDVRRRGNPIGRLHGIPLGIKDIIDTAHLPTEWGCELFTGRIARDDAALVGRLRQEGAVVMGKTVSAEMASFGPGKTRNPHNNEHTPGGSSSGSAAAVAAYMVPGSVGSQTNGSVIRPASFCGVHGFKPSHGFISCRGVLKQSPFLDQVGVFARSVEDVALLAEVMTGSGADPSAYMPQQPLLNICRETPPAEPRVAMVMTSRAQLADQSTREGFEQLAEALGERLDRLDLPTMFDHVWDWLATVNYAEMAANYGPLLDGKTERISRSLASQMDTGRAITALDYQNALSRRDQLNAILDEIFDSYDALITPAAIGEAPRGLETTGDPVFCTPWSFCGVPAVTLPLLQGQNDLPVGVQLVGAFQDDGRLLRTARWLESRLLQE